MSVGFSLHFSFRDVSLEYEIIRAWIWIEECVVCLSRSAVCMSQLDFVVCADACA